MSDEFSVRSEGAIIGIVVMSLGFYLSGWVPKKDIDNLRSELEQAKLDLQVLNATSGHNHALATACREELVASLESLEKTCTLADKYLHQIMEYSFEGTSDNMAEIPCDTSVPVQVRLHEVDTKNEWAYLGYVVDGEQRFTGPLMWEDDRNTIRVRVPGKMEEVIFLTVHTCESKDLCQMSCFAFEPPSGHTLSCSNAR